MTPTERRWRPVPVERACRDDRAIGLSAPDRALYLLLFLACDDRGNFARADRPLRLRIAWFEPGLGAALKRLAGAGLVLLYTVDGLELGHLVDYDRLVALSWQKDLAYPEPPAKADTVSGTVGGDGVADGAGHRVRGRSHKTVSDTVSGTVSDTVGGDGVGHRVTPPSSPPSSSPPTPPLSPSPTPPTPDRPETQARVSARARVQEPVEGPAWTPPPWPTPEHERAAERFVAAIRERTGHPAPYKPSALAELAVEHAAHFVAAVAEAERLGVGWKGWHVAQPRNWLRTLCVQAAEESTRKRRAPPPPPEPPVLVNGMPPITDAEREAYEQLVATSPFPKFAAERERRARLKAEQAQETI